MWCFLFRITLDLFTEHVHFWNHRGQEGRAHNRLYHSSDHSSTSVIQHLLRIHWANRFGTSSIMMGERPCLYHKNADSFTHRSLACVFRRYYCVYTGRAKPDIKATASVQRLDFMIEFQTLSTSDDKKNNVSFSTIEQPQTEAEQNMEVHQANILYTIFGCYYIYLRLVSRRTCLPLYLSCSVW